MSKEKFEQASENLYGKMDTDGIKGILMYAPFSDEYWKENPKIVICNYEAIGYHDSEKPIMLTYEVFRGWLTNKINSKTSRFTAVFANTLLKMLISSGDNNFSSHDMTKLYGQIDELFSSMKNIMHMNIRPTGAKSNKMEKNNANSIIKKYKNEIKAYIESLDADIFVLSSKDAVNLFNIIFNDSDKPLVYKGNKKINDTIVFSVRHFSRFNYRYMYKKAQEISCIWFHK